MLAVGLEGVELFDVAAGDLRAERGVALDEQLNGLHVDALREAIGMAQHRHLAEITDEHVRHRDELRERPFTAETSTGVVTVTGAAGAARRRPARASLTRVAADRKCAA